MIHVRKNSIHNTFMVSLVLIGLLSIILVGVLWISSEKLKFGAEAKALRADYIKEQKDILQREISHAHAFVRYMKSQTEKRLKDDIKNRVYEAHAIAGNIYAANRGTKSKDEILALIKDALRPIRFNKGRGYYFAFDLNGIETLFPVRPRMEGEDMMPVRGGKGERVVPDMLDIVKTQGEGFYRYYWAKPDTGGFFPKIAFVKLIESVGCVIGTGEYLDAVEQDIQEECIKWISNIRFGTDGYLFVGKWDGICLSGPAAGRNMLAETDPNGVEVVRELISAARSGGGFVRYMMPGGDGRTQGAKLSYAVGVPDWQWYIGAGVYVDEIETVVDAGQAALNKRIRQYVLHTVSVLAGLLVLIAILSKLISVRVRKNLALFSDFFDRAATDATRMDPSALHFSEFARMAEAANAMAEKRQEAENALQISHQQFLSVMDGIDSTIYVADMETYEILFMNKYMKDRFGRDMTGEKCHEVFRSEPAPCSTCTNDRLVDDSGASTGVCIRHDMNPATGKWFINHDRAIKWTDGRLVRLHIATDVTELKQMEAQMRQAQKMESVGRLAGGVAHDFNNMLSIILGNTEMMLDDVDPDSGLVNNLEEIQKAAGRSTELVRQLLAFARKQIASPRVLDLNGTMAGMLNMLKRLIGEDINLVWLPANDLWPVKMDPSQVDQILANLCVNAREAISGVGKVSISTANTRPDADYHKDNAAFRPGDYVCITVTDSGIGMDKGILDRMFEPFFTTKDVGEGSGLGLSTVYGIIRQNNGFIDAQSEPGKGTTFRLYLPRHRETADTSGDTGPDKRPRTGKETILLVEDETAILEMTTRILERLGYSVLATASPTEAVRMAGMNTDQKVDLLMTDVIMPEMNGRDLANELARANPGLKCLFMSGHTADVVARDGVPEKDLQFIGKPFSKRDLAAKLRTILDS